ncbi:DUF1707 domain-containing protein [Streptomyces subrutilus]|uniref:DUF1707 and DUF2154 domain-containing protein n=1 Tax=Streptomyces subrutilus TaxID=36818 RepID=A0A5P2UMQ4_9ACTN|nr:DUF1707 domain-containing protein [Streptomyces subrutilus]QEU80438.1 DUF1707 and DUF2154 domain-containing protein [Streptomyces subrutilus]WSJ30267.1 DUF1707 domain-containing protein [Streptomyces subrutilus]GGZ75520.1 hypothetical protein GCM10010371_39150 [Streptomyces subrutilus]
MSDERAQKPLPELRASDADRDRVVERLRDAVAEGRLDMEEFEERLEAAYTSRTYGELEPLTRDLPAVPGVPGGVVAPYSGAAPSPAAASSWASRIGGTAGSGVAVAVMSGFERKGRWTVPARFDAVAFWGGGELDLREADFAQREVVINCIAIMGGIQITVPPGVEVDVRGIGIMGAFDQSNPGPAEPGAPRVVVNGLAFWGGVEVKVKRPKNLPPGPTSLRKEL